MRKTFLIRASGLTESPFSWGKVPFETTLVEKTEESYVTFESIREKYKQNGFDVLWIYYIRKPFL